jgi:hypothetical protein
VERHCLLGARHKFASHIGERAAVTDVNFLLGVVVIQAVPEAVQERLGPAQLRPRGGHVIDGGLSLTGFWLCFFHRPSR